MPFIQSIVEKDVNTGAILAYLRKGLFSAWCKLIYTRWL